MLVPLQNGTSKLHREVLLPEQFFKPYHSGRNKKASNITLWRVLIDRNYNDFRSV
jgi:hypothetical protein